MEDTPIVHSYCSHLRTGSQSPGCDCDCGRKESVSTRGDHVDTESDDGPESDECDAQLRLVYRRPFGAHEQLIISSAAYNWREGDESTIRTHCAWKFDSAARAAPVDAVNICGGVTNLTVILMMTGLSCY